VIRNCYANRYSQQGFFFAKNCDRVLVQNCEADGSPGGVVPGDVSQVGFQSGLPKAPHWEGNTHLTFEDCVSRNNLDKDRGQSWVQGDGFLAEPADRHLKFRRCRSFDASDGCYDLKAEIDEFTDCVAIGPARCFKLWSQTFALTNCIAILTSGGSFRTTGTTSALEINNRGSNGQDLGGHIRAQLCTFSVGKRGYAIYGESARATFDDCIVSFISPEAEKGVVELHGRDVAAAHNRTAVHWHSSDSNPPNYLNPVDNWNGMGSNYDSQTYGTIKGYHSSRIVSSTLREGNK
jgi:hypothetical protein